MTESHPQRHRARAGRPSPPRAPELGSGRFARAAARHQAATWRTAWRTSGRGGARGCARRRGSRSTSALVVELLARHNREQRCASAIWSSDPRSARRLCHGACVNASGGRPSARGKRGNCEELGERRRARQSDGIEPDGLAEAELGALVEARARALLEVMTLLRGSASRRPGCSSERPAAGRRSPSVSSRRRAIASAISS